MHFPEAMMQKTQRYYLSGLAKWRWVCVGNPNGIESSSPGLMRGTSIYPGLSPHSEPTLKGLYLHSRREEDIQPFQGRALFENGPRVGARASYQPWAGSFNAFGVTPTLAPDAHRAPLQQTHPPTHPSASLRAGAKCCYRDLPPTSRSGHPSTKPHNTI